MTELEEWLGGGVCFSVLWCFNGVFACCSVIGVSDGWIRGRVLEKLALS